MEQRHSDYPSWRLGLLGVELEESPAHACSYLPGREARFRDFRAATLSAAEYQACMDAGFRRSGRFVYQPMCAGCRECVPLRVPVEAVVLTKSMRRVLRGNEDLTIRVGRQEATAEKFLLYQKYQREWHGKAEPETPASFLGFLYDSPVETMDFEYRDKMGRLVGVGICDIGPGFVSSVYFYFDPLEARRSLGTFSALYEILWAQRMRIPYWYAGYWVKDAATMRYKARFEPHELLGTDGVWRRGG